jgi:NAD-dependent SIR2 family protein deacetylase
MTVFLPLDTKSDFPSIPSYLRPSANPEAQIRNVVKTIVKARRIVVVQGAGISVATGIPDFRSSEGLFKAQRHNGKDTLVSGKDLFDASVFNSEHSTALFCQMIARLSELSAFAQPSPFHQVLKSLDDRSSLLRIYTQNVDAIEMKAGLSFGVPELLRNSHSRSKRKTPLAVTQDEITSQPNSPVASSSTSALVTPRCIPLHGTLQTVHCATCTSAYPLVDHHASLLCGMLPFCPDCTAAETTREVVGKRSRGVGRLRPSVVLYNEDHKHAENIGEMVRRDLLGSSKGSSRSGADLLLVVGTSLKVPGTKRIVREFSKAVRHPRGIKETTVQQLHTPSPSPRRTPTNEEEAPINSIYVNLDFPVPTREWQGVFDVWVQGDAQRFASLLKEEMDSVARLKEQTAEKKKSRQTPPHHSHPHDRPANTQLPTPCTPPSKKRRVAEEDPPSPSLRAKKIKKEKPAKHSEVSHAAPVPKLYIRIPARPHAKANFYYPLSSSEEGSLTPLTLTPPGTSSPVLLADPVLEDHVSRESSIPLHLLPHGFHQRLGSFFVKPSG